MAEQKPWISMSGHYREFNAYSKDDDTERRIQIGGVEKGSLVYVAVWEMASLRNGQNIGLLDINVDRQDFIDSMLVLFPELTRR